MISTPVIEQQQRHTSARRYTDEPVPREVVQAVVAVGQRAATSSNLQLYSAVAVTESAARHHLAELCADQIQIYQAPVFVAWCADLSRLVRVAKARGYDFESRYVENFLVATVDTALLMQNAALAAESLGYGICFIGAIRSRPTEVIAALGLPRFTFPIAGMTLGRPAQEADAKPRLATDAILYWERYDTGGEQQHLERYDEAMIATSIYQGRQVPAAGAEGETEAYGWQEHSARRTSSTPRTGLRAVLEAQGFGLK